MGFLSRWFTRLKPPLDLEARIACFREVLHANNTALGFIAQIQEGLQGERAIGASDVRRLVARVTVETYRMVANLDRMIGDPRQSAIRCFNAIRAELAREVDLTPALTTAGLAVPLADLDGTLAEVVGQKSAFLGEAARIAPGHVPAGFATTVAAYRAFMDNGTLGDRISGLVAAIAPDQVSSCFGASAQIVQMIEAADIPEDVERAIERAVSAMPGYPDLKLAVRSSALQEGGVEMSFAGQYRSLLNVPPDGVAEAFRRVVASKYSPEALTYRLGRGFRDDEVAMCCCVVTMVDAVAAGVLYTAFPTVSGAHTVLQAVRGLGLSAVDGSAEPDSFVIDRKARRVIDAKRGLQDELLQCAPGEGTERIPLDHGTRAAPAVTSEQALRVAELAWQIEARLGPPLDVEWAIDRADRIFVLQVRPLTDVAGAEVPRKSRVAGAGVLVERGVRVCGGAASGPVCPVASDLDVLRCPAGAVVVVREANPRYAVLLPRASALVADLGEVTGHLATVARELRVPALFATRHATSSLVAGTMVTVDADARVVYAGRVEQALAVADQPSASGPRDPNRALLATVAKRIVPLTYRDRLASGYSPRRCKTLHDIIRYCHQATVEAMFDMGDRAVQRGQVVRRLISEVPIDCRVFDLGGGLREGVADHEIVLDDVSCVPLRALWRGMTDPRLPWRQERAVSLSGFISAMANYNFDQDSRTRNLGEPSYVFISADYMNLNSRIGYHFSTVDARIGDNVESNYASFRFVGGSTGIEQRSRRALLIQRLLAAHGFETDCRADLVNARVRHRPTDEIERSLVLVGLVITYVNHLDMVLTSDQVVRRYEEAFLAGDYGYNGSADNA
jgi:pyruvate,water dikinase